MVLLLLLFRVGKIFINNQIATVTIIIKSTKREAFIASFAFTFFFCFTFFRRISVCILMSLSVFHCTSLRLPAKANGLFFDRSFVLKFFFQNSQKWISPNYFPFFLSLTSLFRILWLYFMRLNRTEREKKRDI